MNQKLVELKQVSVRSGNASLLDNIDLTIYRHQQWAIVGASGSGKTTLAHALLGRAHYLGEIRYYPSESGEEIRPAFVEQQHHFKSLSNTNDLYYQQRFNSSDSENTILVSDALEHHTGNKWIGVLHLEPLLNKPLIQLSNGENKRLQLAKALISSPSMLILDNPFTGLDKEGRKTLNTIIGSISEAGIHILLITSPGDLPPAITHVAVLENGRIISSGEKAKVEHLHAEEVTAYQFNLDRLTAPVFPDFKDAVKMEDVTIRYGEKTILSHISWQVKKGESWSVSGPNGAGKSTLLSLLTGDNPQAYANKIYLFDKRRGTGESIWDIKRNIGFVSPELHLHFEQSATSFEVIASGLFDTIGLFRRISERQEASVMEWMQLMNLEAARNKPLRQLSNGQQRMILLARALVKNPPLLILDEPCQGLDEHQVIYFKQLIGQIHEKFGTTLICVSHYDHELPECIDHFLYLNNGQVQPR